MSSSNPRHRLCAVAVWTIGGLLVSPGASSGQQQRRVALTFDDLPVVAAGPGQDAPERVTEGILRALAALGAPAYAFVNEGQLDESRLGEGRGSALLARWAEAGHGLGNHTYGHTWLYESGAERFIQDIERGERVWRPMVEDRPGFRPYLRHPRLNTGRSMKDRRRVEKYLDSIGYAVAPVSIDNNEYLFANAYARSLGRGDHEIASRIGDAYLVYMDSIFAYYEEQSIRILGREPAHVLLLHANRLNADYLAPLLSRIQARGYVFVPMDEALRDPAYALPDEYVGRAGITWLHRWAITEGLPPSTFQGEPPVPDWVLEAGGSFQPILE